jgi:hypothetical protein
LKDYLALVSNQDTHSSFGPELDVVFASMCFQKIFERGQGRITSVAHRQVQKKVVYVFEVEQGSERCCRAHAPTRKPVKSLLGCGFWDALISVTDVKRHFRLYECSLIARFDNHDLASPSGALAITSGVQRRQVHHLVGQDSKRGVWHPYASL